VHRYCIETRKWRLPFDLKTFTMFYVRSGRRISGKLTFVRQQQSHIGSTPPEPQTG